ncbi:MAG: S41 family peptidase [Gammaproteobacteria bacterium]|nr:S41 family peptidase [Gammaproteobacteria bacterium]
MPSNSQTVVQRLVIAFFAVTLSWQVGAKEPQEPRLPLEELRTFVEVMERIKSAYVEPIDDKTLLENAIKGMLNNLDPHSSYLDPKAFQELQESTSGEFGGLGIEVGMEDDVLKVVSPIDDTPAFQAGIEAQDFIIKIDGQPTKGMSLMDAVAKMRGKPGTSIVLTIARENRAPFDVKLKRAIIKAQSVRAQTLEQGYGLIRISQFQSNTANEVSKALRKLNQDKNNLLKGLVLDLRNNPGGLLQAAIDVTDLFIDQGLIVYTKGRLDNSEQNYFANSRTSIGDIPLVILVNSGSASASEIVAGALQDHKRGIVMGTNSFGKGSVQTILPLNNEHALKLTTALYYTPLGRSIQAEGIEPDIVVERAKISQEQQSITIKEADLVGHLNNDKSPSTTDKKNTADAITDDYQLNQALNLLKGLNIIANKEKVR